ncbi:MAG: class I SAM-dependent methyltransferase, partial [Promethearchaeota archaeon]
MSKLKKVNNFYLIYIKILVRLHNFLYHKISQVASKINGGIHPKHRIMNYHQYFLDNIRENSKVLDVGCGKGLLAFDLAKKATKVVAIDNDRKSIQIANLKYRRENIIYIEADANKLSLDEKFDYVVLSNVLEHIKQRKPFLKQMKELGSTLLIRV